MLINICAIRIITQLLKETCVTSIRIKLYENLGATGYNMFPGMTFDRKVYKLLLQTSDQWTAFVYLPENILNEAGLSKRKQIPPALSQNAANHTPYLGLEYKSE